VERFKLPVEVDERTAEELRRLYIHPELDHDEVKRIVKHYLADELHWPEDEAERIAEQAARVIDERLKLRGRPARPITLADLLGIASTATSIETRPAGPRRRRPRVERLEKKAVELVTGGGESYRVIYSLRELEMSNYIKLRMAQSRTPEEAEKRLREVYHALPAQIILAPTQSVTAFTFTNRPILCKAEWWPRRNMVRLLECEKPVVLVEVRGGRVYYQVVGSEKR